MHYQVVALYVLAILLVGSQIVTAGQGGFIDIINATPYDMQRTYMHSYKMIWSFPPTVAAGTSLEQYVEYKAHGNTGDSGAEVTYRLVGHPEKASFTVQARQKRGKRIEVQYHDQMKSLNNPENSLLNLGWVHDGAVAFVLGGNGTDTPFVSNNAPLAWMQATLPTIGRRTMRDIALPASHDSGMSALTRKYGGVVHNTLTQSSDVYQQLKAGARFFDIRPVIRSGKWFTNHVEEFPQRSGSYMGGFGRSLPDIISDVNRFNSEAPGEMVILDLSHELKRMPLKGWDSSLTPGEWQSLYTLLQSLNTLFVAPANTADDLTSIPVSTFIQPGSKPAVLIRVPNHAPPPSPEHAGIFPARRIPHTGSWPNAGSADQIAPDQLRKLSELRQTPQWPPLMSTWTVTQKFPQLINVGVPDDSIIGMAAGAHKVLYGELWMGMKRAGKWVNLLEVDDFKPTVTSLVMAINEYFANGLQKRDLESEKRVLRIRGRVAGVDLDQG